jgi:hypothetical protein
LQTVNLVTLATSHHLTISVISRLFLNEHSLFLFRIPMSAKTGRHLINLFEVQNHCHTPGTKLPIASPPSSDQVLEVNSPIRNMTASDARMFLA